MPERESAWYYDRGGGQGEADLEARWALVCVCGLISFVSAGLCVIKHARCFQVLLVGEMWGEMSIRRVPAAPAYDISGVSEYAPGITTA